MNMMVITGDIGGTKARLRLSNLNDLGAQEILETREYASAEFLSFDDVLEAFASDVKLDGKKLAGVCLGVAGPVLDGNVKFTNLSWVIRADDLKSRFKTERVILINDFMATGYGLETLQEEDLLTLQPGKCCMDGIKAYLGAGTGLGTGFLVGDQDNYKVYPTEAGHVDFAAVNELQIRLFNFLRKKYGRVSLERVLSGRGLTDIYRFMCLQDNSSNLDVITATDITKYADTKNDVVAERAIDLFIQIYGAAAGNLALTFLPLGGVYIVGGIALKIASQIKNGCFMESFVDKGRMSEIIKSIPLNVVLNPNVGLQGAAVYLKRIMMV